MKRKIVEKEEEEREEEMMRKQRMENQKGRKRDIDEKKVRVSMQETCIQCQMEKVGIKEKEESRRWEKR